MDREQIREIYYAVKNDPEQAILRLMRSLSDEQHLLLLEIHLQELQDELVEYLAEL